MSQSYDSKQLATDIIGKGPAAPRSPRAAIAPHGGHKLPHSIEINPVANGVTVQHMPADTQHGGGDYAKKQTHAFTDLKSAHAHVGKLMGCDTGE